MSVAGIAGAPDSSAIGIGVSMVAGPYANDVPKSILVASLKSRYARTRPM